VIDDGTLMTSALDSELSGAARAFRLSHDLLAQLTETGGAGSLNHALNVGGIHFAARGRSRWSGTRCGFKPQRIGIQRQQARCLGGSVTALEAQLDRRH